MSADELLAGSPAASAAALSSDDARLKAVLEAIVYVTEEPLSAEQIAAALGEPRERVEKLLEHLVAEFDRPEHGDPHALILPVFARSHRIHSPGSQRIQRPSASDGPAHPTVSARERDQPPVPAVITLTESSLTDDDAHPVVL